MINAVTFNTSLLVKCNRNCKWCYLKKERKNAKYGGLNTVSRKNITELTKQIKIAVGTDESDTNVLYISLPCIRVNNTQQVNNLTAIISSFLVDINAEGINFDQIHILGQPAIANHMKEQPFLGMRNLTGMIVCISDVEDINKLAEITLRDYDRIVMTEVDKDGNIWPYEILKDIAEVVQEHIDHAGATNWAMPEIMVESVFNEKHKTYKQTHHIAYILESMGVSAVASQCSSCTIKDTKCILETSQIKSIETINGHLNIGCPYKIGR